QRAGVERAVRSGDDPTERDALGSERLLDPVSFRSGALGGGRCLGVQLGAHLAGEERHRTHAEEVRRIALIRAARPLAVAPQERVLRLRAGAVGPALGMTAEAAEGIRPSGKPLMDAA